MPAKFNMDSDMDTLRDYAEGPLPVTRRAMRDDPVDPTPQQLAPLTYDFDIVEAAPDAAQQAHLDALAALGQTDGTVNLMICWRDPRTIAAIQKAGPAVRAIFEDAGFGYQVSDSRIAAGSYDIVEGPHRHETIMHLTNRLAQSDASKLDWGQFDIAAFFKATAEANGIRTGLAPETTHKPGIDQKRKIALLVMLGGVALIAMAGLAML